MGSQKKGTESNEYPPHVEKTEVYSVRQLLFINVFEEVHDVKHLKVLLISVKEHEVDPQNGGYC